MIPKVIGVVKDREKPIENLQLECQEVDCKRKLNENTAFVYIDNIEVKPHLICETCLRIKIATKCVAYSDTYEFYLKRKRSGFIEQITEEFKRRKNGKDQKST